MSNAINITFDDTTATITDAAIIVLERDHKLTIHREFTADADAVSSAGDRLRCRVAGGLMDPWTAERMIYVVGLCTRRIAKDLCERNAPSTGISDQYNSRRDPNRCAAVVG